MDLDLPRGQITGLIGPNGAGKTTLFTLVSGFETPSNGTVVFDGDDITTLPTHERARRGIARTFQIVQPFAGLSVVENIAVGAYLRSPHRAEAFAAAEFLMDYLKSRAPFWKKEFGTDGEAWVAARDEDEDQLKRW